MMTLTFHLLSYSTFS